MIKKAALSTLILFTVSANIIFAQRWEIEGDSYYMGDPVAFKEVQNNWLRNQVLRLRKIYMTMLDELMQVGAPIHAVEKFTDENSRYSTVVATSPEAPTELLRTADLFEK